MAKTSTKFLAASAVAVVMASGVHSQAVHHAHLDAVIGGTGATSTSANAELGERMAAAHGWSGAQWSCLHWLWTRESGWDSVIRNPGGAFGIAEALGHGDSSSAAYNVHYVVSEGVGPEVGTVNEYGPGYGLSTGQAREANAGSAPQQIRWGFGYIKSTYGTPCGAWNHEEGDGWY